MRVEIPFGSTIFPLASQYTVGVSCLHDQFCLILIVQFHQLLNSYVSSFILQTGFPLATFIAQCTLNFSIAFFSPMLGQKKAIRESRSQFKISELNVDNGNDNCEAKSEAKRPRSLHGFQVDFTRNVSRGQIII